MQDFLDRVCLVNKLSEAECEHPIAVNIKYASDDNLVGRIIEGYQPHPEVQRNAILCRQAAQALCSVQKDLNRDDLGLIIKDSYRPRRAVLDFLRWTQDGAELNDNEHRMKAKHYPEHDKSELFELGYFSEDSSHCYGNTVDVMLIDLSTNELVDMGSPFDFMGERSHLTMTETDLGQTAFQNRKRLQDAMLAADFEPYETEFWHFSHRGEAGRIAAAPFDHEINIALMRAIETR